MRPVPSDPRNHRRAARCARFAILALTTFLALGSKVHPVHAEPDPRPDWWIQSNVAGMAYGTSVSSAGDVNGDGAGDIVVGCPGARTGGSTTGEAKLYMGSASGLAISSSWAMFGPQDGGRFGASVSGAGDVNGDGYDDVIIGAPDYGAGETREGRADLYLGGPAGLADTPAWTVESNQADAGLGWAVAGVGDVNGDGRDDVAVGVPGYSHGQAQEGRVYVYFGTPNGLSPTPSHSRECNVIGARMGQALGWAGDLSADGYDDLVIGAPEYGNGQASEGMAAVYLGGPTGLAPLPAWVAEGGQVGAGYGTSVSGLGDVNGDGYGDLAVGAPYFDNGQSNEGRVSVYLGHAGGPSPLADWTTDSNQASACLGFSVSTAGDFDGDGYADLLAGIPYWDRSGVDEGTVRVHLGGPDGLSAGFRAYNPGIVASLFGACVSGAGDIDADGRSDIVVGAPDYSDGQTNEGAAFLYCGEVRALRQSPSWTWYGPAAADHDYYRFNSAIGDWNGDGISDLAAGNPFYLSYTGRVDVFYGRPGETLPPAADRAVAGTATYSAFGASVACAGDLNGDGYDDLAVGAPGIPYHGWWGQVVVFLGGPNGLSTTPAAQLASDSPIPSFFGNDVACAGDVNGDGFADLLVGESQWNYEQGRALLYLGAEQGVSLQPQVTMEEVWGYTGAAVSTAGDVNGDGYDDWLVGSPAAGSPGHYVGSACLYLGGAVVDSAPDTTLSGNGYYGSFGSAVAALGDADGDGCGDFAIGAPGPGSSGCTTVFRGSRTGEVTALTSIVGERTYDGFGASIAAADIDSDGLCDLIVGAPFHDPNQYLQREFGRAYIYLAPFDGIVVPYWQVTGEQENDMVGMDLAFGDLDGDGQPDVALGRQPDASNRTPDMRVFHSSDWPGPDRRIRQLRMDVASPIAVGDGTDENGFWLQGWARHPMGRVYLSAQTELEPAGTPLDGADLQQGGWFDTGAPTPGHGSRQMMSHMVSGLPDGNAWHWRVRLRTRSRWAPYTQWVTPAGGLVHQANVRTINEVAADVPGTPAGGTALRIALLGANPLRGPARFALDLAKEAPVRLTICDATGRQVCDLVAESMPAGRHEAVWDLTTPRGEQAASGVYFARLAGAGETRSVRFVVVD